MPPPYLPAWFPSTTTKALSELAAQVRASASLLGELRSKVESDRRAGEEARTIQARELKGASCEAAGHA